MKDRKHEAPKLAHPERVAELLDTTKKHVRDLVREGELEGVTIGGPRSLRVTLESVEKFIDRNRVK